ncbi:PepSY-like domain-containing protein [Brumimicrobium oceani]|uniref:Putative beta-lactamase-inhibitor-like PepSY-like domain-containing protein n=1 Tax=Brumimicrobium oceani TaxID=2100725 RepID=A0A2U2XEG3_9FLAO|nr:PepSY-like domain-containing protein [Brumimicrobium oceani]PWH86175.1 hypothetical protein DIT68_06365 [Brumimicrobium oceani]
MNTRKIIENTIITTAIGIVILRLKKDKIVYVDTLPEIIKDYVSIHFPEHFIKKAVTYKVGFKRSYKVFLNGKINLKFNNKGKAIEIESGNKLPDSVVPTKLASFVTAYFPENSIVEWELERNAQEIELDNGLELAFDLNGDFINVEK